MPHAFEYMEVLGKFVLKLKRQLWFKLLFLFFCFFNSRSVIILGDALIFVGRLDRNSMLKLDIFVYFYRHGQDGSRKVLQFTYTLAKWTWQLQQGWHPRMLTAIHTEQATPPTVIWFTNQNTRSRCIWDALFRHRYTLVPITYIVSDRKFALFR